MMCMIKAVQKKTLSDRLLYVRAERAVFAVADEAPDSDNVSILLQGVETR